MKRCGTCKETKSLASFGVDKSRKSGLNVRCKQCVCQKFKQHKINNPDSHRKSKRHYYATHSDQEKKRLAKYLHTFSQEQWQQLCEKYDNVCLACKQIKLLTVDHVIPLSLGGSDDIDSNIQPLCGLCNSIKGAKIIDYRPQLTFS